MMVTTKGRYGLRVLLDVAMHQEKGTVAMREIARRQELSQKYLWQVINPLKRAGFLRSIRGTQGGYVLARDPGAITVRDIVEIMEGPVGLVACVTEPGLCERSVDCVVREVWSEIEEKVVSAMAGVTLRDIIQRQNDQADSAGTSYVI